MKTYCDYCSIIVFYLSKARVIYNKKYKEKNRFFDHNLNIAKLSPNPSPSWAVLVL